MTNTTDANWRNDAIQFPRLLAELRAAGIEDNEAIMKTTADSMDLTVHDVETLFDRAQEAWDAIVAATPGGPYPQIVTPPQFECDRSCFIDFATEQAAEHAIAKLATTDGIVEHRVNNTFHHEADDGDDEYWSVFFSLNCDNLTAPGLAAEEAFITAATALGGRYSGS